MTGPMTFKKATRQAVKIKLAIAGPSGSGKTDGALALARHLAPGGRVAVVDTENGSASLYSDRYEFDVIDLEPPYESRFFSEAIDVAVAGGYDVLIIDSLSHQWEGSGGILDRKTVEERNTKNANGFAIWAKYKEEHRRFIAHMLHAPIHVIACLRSRQEYVQEGRSVKKVGMNPISGENAEYEFSILFELNMEHVAQASKDRTGIFDQKFVDLRNPAVGKAVREWLASGAPLAAAPAVAEGNGSASSSSPATSSTGSMRSSRTATPSARRSASSASSSASTGGERMTLEQAKAYPFPFQRGKPTHGRPLADCATDFLESVSGWIHERQAENGEAWHAETITAIRLVLEDREKDQTKLELGEPAPAAPDPAPSSGAVVVNHNHATSPNAPDDFDL